ncbi:MAG: type II toxin-antitoxin system VapC family toxin [Nitrospinae bacterium]|nr:type II toxin-antitoxin system VapC family toxin [Nitrospinota bacterium]
MNSHILDASAVLAVINGENGSEVVLQAIEGGDTAISAVNYSEVVAKLATVGISPDAADTMINALELTVVPFDAETATEAGLLYLIGAKAGLSFADRACLALSKQTGLPALTADKAWAGLKFTPKIRLIR